MIERLKATGATDFGVPDFAAKAESDFYTKAECERQITLIQACWTYFDETSARVSPQLQKGPRGGGRDRDKIVDHVLESERNYARNLGVQTSPGAMGTPEGLAEHREAVLQAIREHNANQQHARAWPLRYFLSRTCWHPTDHAWEMEEKDPGNAN